MSLLHFLTCTDHLDLVRIIYCLVQHIDHVLGFFVCELAVSLLVVGSGSSLEHAQGAYIVAL